MSRHLIELMVLKHMCLCCPGVKVHHLRTNCSPLNRHAESKHWNHPNQCLYLFITSVVLCSQFLTTIDDEFYRSREVDLC